MHCLDTLGCNLNQQLQFEISILEFVLLQSLVQKQKSLNLWPKTPDLHILKLEVENNYAIFEISILEFVLLQSLVQKQNVLNLGPKNAWFR